MHLNFFLISVKYKSVKNTQIKKLFSILMYVYDLCIFFKKHAELLVSYRKNNTEYKELKRMFYFKFKFDSSKYRCDVFKYVYCHKMTLLLTSTNAVISWSLVAVAGNRNWFYSVRPLPLRPRLPDYRKWHHYATCGSVCATYGEEPLW